MSCRTRTFRVVASVLLLLLIAESIVPTVALALTQGPTQPEFSTFEPVGGNNLVDPFTGAFSYSLPVLSIPGPNGMGYALSLSYHSGASIEDEASWVGYGWTLNPGAITRVKRGFPDDYKGAPVKYWNNVRDNWTATVTKKVGLEYYSKEPLPTPKDPNNTSRQEWASINGFLTHRFNNYKGYGFSWGLTAGVMGAANLGYTETDDVGSFSYSVNPVALLGRLKVLDPKTLVFSANDAWYKTALNWMAMSGASGALSQNASSTGLFGMFNFNDYQMPYNTTEYDGSGIEIAAAVEGDPFSFPIGIEGGIKGSYMSQTGKKLVDRNVYGYMYSGSAQNESDLMDYYLEKESTYQKRDLFLPIPFSNADQFNVSAEGLGGMFRLHHSKPGKFRPNRAESSTDITHVNADIHLGGTFGLGANIGYGWQSLTVEDWLSGGYSFSPADQEDEPYFFRFAEDMGGSVEFSDNDDPVLPSILTDFFGTPQDIGIGGMFGDKRLNSQGTSAGINPNRRSGRSAYIGYSTNAEMSIPAPLTCSYPYWGASPVKFRRHAKANINDSPSEENEHDWLDRNEAAIKDGIGEFAITKENGMQYIYDLPVYTRDETNLQYGLTGIGADKIKENFLAYHYEPLALPSDEKNNPGGSIIGEESHAPYAATYLLTEIRSPDYLDRTNNGLTSDDIGGYVRFNYTKVAGEKSKVGPLDNWYRWRSPYRGLHYQRNSLSDPFDDVGSVNSGYKEMYYLSTIETKTHIAIFTTEQRRDGYQAHHDEKTASSSEGATTVPTSGTAQSTLRSLKKVELYAKDGQGQPGDLLVTVNFEYDYSLCKSLPNAEAGQGKLTLKKVWFEYEGVKSPHISPYEFGYSYKESNHFAGVPFTGLGQHYEKIVKYGNAFTPSGGVDPENPNYSPFDVDRWGSYQYNGFERHQRFNQWVNQKPDPMFDPAAWQLKWIKLPSGGEIHVQYEQNEYRFVQHRPAMVMMNLQDKLRHHNDIDEPYTKFAIDVDDVLPVSSDPVEYVKLLDSLKTQIERYFIKGVNGDPEHMFFKFAYALEGTQTELDRCSSEFISGYVRVKSVSVEPNGLASKLWVELGNPDDEEGYTLPDQVCESFVRSSRGGIIKAGPCAGMAYDDENEVDDGMEAVMKLLVSFEDYFDADNNCRELSLQDSYLRIPLSITRAKKGGGIRVKRVLTYDKGLESSEDAALYGTEYLYETEDGFSSGVATNEPSVGRDENSLIGIIEKREAQNGYEMLFSGEDRDQFEGPIGESIMPAASVGYSRVVARNIYPGATTTGFVVNEFYTAYDYPFDLKYANVGTDFSGLGTAKTPIDGPADVRYSLMTGIYNRSKSSLRRSQGLRFVLNSMHGKPKSVSSHGGNYQRGKKPTAPIEASFYDYFQPGEQIPVMRDLSTGEIENAWLGKEMEVVFESRQVEDASDNLSVQLDFGVGVFGFIVLPYFAGSPSYNDFNHSLKTFVSSKVVRYPSIQKRVIVVKDGVRDTTENIAFDPESGSPVRIRSADGFHNLSLLGSPPSHDGSYYTQSIPASWYYRGMGQKARSERTIFYNDMTGTGSGCTFNKRFVRENGNEYHYLTVIPQRPGGEIPVLQTLFPGDLLSITLGSGENKQYLGIYHVGRIVGNKVELLPTSYSLRSTLTEERYVDVEIVHSGRSNKVGTTAGEFTTYGKPPTIINHPLQ